MVLMLNCLKEKDISEVVGKEVRVLVGRLRNGHTLFVNGKVVAYLGEVEIGRIPAQDPLESIALKTDFYRVEIDKHFYLEIARGYIYLK